VFDSSKPNSHGSSVLKIPKSSRVACTQFPVELQASYERLHTFLLGTNGHHWQSGARYIFCVFMWSSCAYICSLIGWKLAHENSAEKLKTVTIIASLASSYILLRLKSKKKIKNMPTALRYKHTNTHTDDVIVSGLIGRSGTLDRTAILALRRFTYKKKKARIQSFIAITANEKLNNSNFSIVAVFETEMGEDIKYLTISTLYQTHDRS